LEDNILLTGEVLQQKWTKFADLVGIPEDERLNLSDGWLSCFKTRNSLKEVKRHGEAASADPGAAERERLHIWELICKSGYGLRGVFSMDETGLFYTYVYGLLTHNHPAHCVIDYLQIVVLLTRKVQELKEGKQD